MTLTFDPHLYLKDITLVGCGGTGSLVARAIARMLFDLKQRRMHLPQVRFIDFDTVEMGNCGRQLFAVGDVGQPKSLVLARRYNLVFGLEIAAITEPVSAQHHFASRGSSIIMEAVDHHDARRELAQVHNAVFISCGNHHASGQIVIGTTHDRQRALHALDREGDTLRELPSAYLLFPSLLEPEPEIITEPDTRSCAELITAGEQHLFINETVANVAAVYLYRLIHRQPITSFLTFVGIDGMPVTRSIPITADNIRSYLSV